jgi:hypothetical protein
MADSIQIVNTYTKNGNNEVGNFAIATGNITNCIPTVATSAVFLENIPPVILEPFPIVPPPPPPPPVYGCTDPTAINYNPTATADDGSCVYINYGCTDHTAVNYNPNATIPINNSCYYNPYFFRPFTNQVTLTSNPFDTNIYGNAPYYDLYTTSSFAGDTGTGIGSDYRNGFGNNYYSPYPASFNTLIGSTNPFWLNSQYNNYLNLKETNPTVPFLSEKTFVSSLISSLTSVYFFTRTCSVTAHTNSTQTLIPPSTMIVDYTAFKEEYFDTNGNLQRRNCTGSLVGTTYSNSTQDYYGEQYIINGSLLAYLNSNGTTWTFNTSETGTYNGFYNHVLTVPATVENSGTYPVTTPNSLGATNLSNGTNNIYDAVGLFPQNTQVIQQFYYAYILNYTWIYIDRIVANQLATLVCNNGLVANPDVFYILVNNYGFTTTTGILASLI